MRSLLLLVSALTLCACNRPAKVELEDVCAHDEDCVGSWRPHMEGCGSTDRCIDGRCQAPPTTTGEAGPHTAKLAFSLEGGPVTYDVEIVKRPFETSRGMMCRTSMRSGWGMLFFMRSYQPQGFWMKNTLIPLDMVFLDEDWMVVGVVHEAPPETLISRRVSEPSLYVLELPGGEAKRVGLAQGVRARFF